ncbi:MAG: hypothetical protein IT308_00825 [Anaerolineaceae bacterium]|nr:hypothetical protein [Anaerolineaceae bacterium]
MKHKLFTGLLIFLMAGIAGCNLSTSTDTPSGGSINVPRAWFDAPLPSTVIIPPNPCQIVAHGSSPNGVAMFELSINGVAASIPSSDTKNSLVTLTHDCGLPDPGEYLLRLRTQDNSGSWSGYAETSLIIAGVETPTPESAVCTNNLDVTFEDPLQKANMTPGQQFTKTWTVQNTGTCTWGEGYHLVFTGGPSMSEGAASMNNTLDMPLGSLVSIPVAPGQKVAIPLAQTAPISEGWYVGAWNLVAPNGDKIPITYSGTTMPSMYVDIVVKAGSPTPPPVGSISIERVSTNQVYLGQASCGPLEVTIAARAFAPKGITVVVLFYRFSTGGSSGDFQSVTMAPLGGDLYQSTLNPTSLLGGTIPFDQATLQYQIVVQQTDNDTSIRTPVMTDITVQACGSIPAPTTAPVCSLYTDNRSCVENGCSWVLKPGIIPIYGCQNP